MVVVFYWEIVLWRRVFFVLVFLFFGTAAVLPGRLIIIAVLGGTNSRGVRSYMPGGAFRKKFLPATRAIKKNNR
jgi:hypothetical protein